MCVCVYVCVCVCVCRCVLCTCTVCVTKVLGDFKSMDMCRHPARGDRQQILAVFWHFKKAD